MEVGIRPNNQKMHKTIRGKKVRDLKKRVRHLRGRKGPPKKTIFTLISALILSAAISAEVIIDGPFFYKEGTGFVQKKLTRWFHIESIEWKELGTSNLSDRVALDELLAVSELKNGDGLLQVSPTQLEKKLMTIPWIQSVQVEKRLPSSIQIQYAVYRARAVAFREGKPWYLSAEGNWIAPVERKHKDLDLPVMMSAGQKSGDFEFSNHLNWLELLEHELGSNIIQVHEISAKQGDRQEFMQALIEISFGPAHVAPRSKVKILGPTVLNSDQVSRLKKVVKYLIEHHILFSTLDLRAGQKVVVNTSNRL